MAIVLGNTASLGAYPQNNMSFSHTLSSGSNRMVIALFILQGNTSYSVSTSTYNSTNMILIGSGISPTLFGRATAVYAYYLPEASLPVAGTYTVVFKATAAYAGAVLVIDLANVVQSAPSYATSGNSHNPNLSGRYSTSITSSAATSLLLDATAWEVGAGANTSNTPDASPAQTLRWGPINMTDSFATPADGSSRFSTGAGSQTMGWTPAVTYSSYEQLVLSIDDIGGSAAAADNAAIMGMWA